MAIIKELSKTVIEKIAAGEVVERPASVVKELVENAIDAGARSIAVEVADGGRKRIAVIDDGCGMDAADLEISVRRHATSKISDEGDLWNIQTMGFRGEALSAIGAVSKLAIETKPNVTDALEGARVDVTGGEVKGPVPAGCPGGTKIVVSDLFYNVPARLKFLRSANVEYGHVTDVISSLALANPRIRFDLMEAGRRRLSIPGILNDDDVRGLEERIVSVLGDRYRDRFTPVAEFGGALSVRGWVAEEGKRGGKDIHIFLNRRPVRDRVLMHAISSAFGEDMRGRYPAAVLWIDIDPSEVDVNVHPTKREVRFSNSGAVHDFVRASVKKAVGGTTPLLCKEGTGEVDRTDRGSTPSISPLQRGRGFYNERETRNEELITQYAIRDTHDGGLRPLGQLGLTYIVCEDEDGTLVLIDQHAAHERLGFDHLKKRYAEGSVPRQQFLIPENVELGTKELAYVTERMDALAAAGFEIEPFGGNTLLVKAVPAILSGISVAPVFEKLAAELEELGTSSSTDDVTERIFAVIACHAQVRGGDKLSHAELQSLVRDIEREDVTHCPHGRPVVVRITKGEIEKWFKRRS